jgi:hypothetical protein
MNLEAVLARLQGARRNRTGWIARCPAHVDRSPSLSIREGGGRRVLLHCFAGCTVESICTALGIKMNALFSQPRRYHNPQPEIVRDAQRQIEGLRSRLSPRDCERAVTVVLAYPGDLDFAIARALALAVEGELVQIAFGQGSYECRTR